MKILYLTQWFDPEPAFKGADFARGLANAGHEVEVATGFPNYPGGKVYAGHRILPYRREIIQGLTVHRLPLYPSHDKSAIGRIANYLSFFLAALIFGLLHGRRYDLVYVYHPPLTPALAAALFCGVNRRPFVVEIQDLWPDSVATSGMANPRIVRALSAACRYVYSKASRVIAQSNGMRAELARRGVSPAKLSTIFNWATYQFEQSTVELPMKVRDAFADRINMVYGGNIGQAQALAVVVEAAIAACARVPALRLHMVGEGIERVALQKLVEERGAGDIVYFHATVPRDTMDRIFDAADILIMHLADDPLYDITIPSKTQHYLACGKPIVAGLAGEAAEILRRSGSTIVTVPGDSTAMAAAMVHIALQPETERARRGKMGAAYYERHFAFSSAISRTSALLQDAQQTPRIASR